MSGAEDTTLINGDGPTKSPLEDDPRFAKRLPRIFVGICAFGDITHEAFESFMLWWGKTCAQYKGRFELYLGVSPRKEQYRARNALVQSAELQRADFLLMMDDDQIPHICENMLGRFWDLGKPIMGGLYFQRGGLFHPVVMKEMPGVDGKFHYRFLHPGELPHEPAPVDVVGHGCMWVDMEVYAKLKQPHHWPYPDEVVFVPEDGIGLDVHFCKRARDAGYEVWLHPKIHIGHQVHDRKWIDVTSRPAQQLIEALPEWVPYWQSVLSEAVGNGHDVPSAA